MKRAKHGGNQCVPGILNMKTPSDQGEINPLCRHVDAVGVQ